MHWYTGIPAARRGAGKKPDHHRSGKKSVAEGLWSLFMIITWWHWLVIGLLLLGLELLFPSFPMVWFGLGGLLTGLVVLLLPGMSPLVQGAFWVVVSLSFTLLWRKYLKPKKEQKFQHRNIVRR
jgi:membrane-bound ClpP family serine protease